MIDIDSQIFYTKFESQFHNCYYALTKSKLHQEEEEEEGADQQMQGESSDDCVDRDSSSGGEQQECDQQEFEKKVDIRFWKILKSNFWKKL